jgi:hypothetical protein
MASLGKKLLSAFMEVGDEKKSAPEEPAATAASSSGTSSGAIGGSGSMRGSSAPADQRFTDYFDKLFSEANIPGPDYYEFARMIVAMQAIPDERSRYAAAFAGLQVQGLDKEKLLSTAGEYLRVLNADADHFGKTVEAALQEKVNGKAGEAEEKGRRIQALSQEIVELQAQISALQGEIKENKDKLESSRNAYAIENERRKQTIQLDMEKIKNYIL